MAAPYIGRFAPSPSGPLHLGSLLCALASYLEAKTHHGVWLVRMEDIDPPREQAGAAQQILTTLSRHGLHWDGDIMWQSQRGAVYEQALQRLARLELSYHCYCTRARLKTLNHTYDGHCRDKPRQENIPSALRINIERARSLQPKLKHLALPEDQLQGRIAPNMQVSEDFIVKRKDGFYAYQLAVVVDDIAQNISHVVRGYDLFPCTHQQALLHCLLESEPPNTGHIAVLNDAAGQKLSKQNHAPALDDEQAVKNLVDALLYLQQSPPRSLYQSQSAAEVLQWALQHWSVEPLRGKTSIQL